MDALLGAVARRERRSGGDMVKSASGNESQDGKSRLKCEKCSHLALKIVVAVGNVVFTPYGGISIYFM